MGYCAEFSGWDKLSQADLLIAYRKAKADCFFENTFPTAIKFADYEQDLLVNLDKLLEQLKSKNRFSKKQEWLGDFRLIPKKLSMNPKNQSSNGHIHFSCPERTFNNLLENNAVKPEFRIIGDFPVETHILSALWINMIGHKFDNSLKSSCYGARLKRIKNDSTLDKNATKPFHVSSIGSFTPYFQPYQRWRKDGLNSIRNELEQGKDVIAVSLDLKSYYHFIDPSSFSSPELYKELNLELTSHEILFTKELTTLLSKWGLEAKKFGKNIIQDDAEIAGGLVIGLTASRIISNVILHRWDCLIKEKISPIHYGRYVDDMFLVLHDTGNINNSDDFMEFLQERLGDKCIFPTASENNKTWEIQQGLKLQKKTKIKLQADKQKLFILQGQGGLDLLDSIEKDIYELSSEHRLMPSPDQLEDSTAARVLSAAGSVGEQADTLRRADGLTIRRLSWSLQLRHVETLARDLPPHEWEEQRKDFYQFAHNHILRPDNLFAHFSYLPRLLGFAISMNEWQDAEQIVSGAFSALTELERKVTKGKGIAINGVDAKAGGDLWRYVRGTLTWLFIDAAARYYSPEKLLTETRGTKEKRLAELFIDGIWEQLDDFNDILDFKFGAEDFYIKAPLVAMADLAKEPYKRIIRSRAANKLLPRGGRNKERKVLSILNSADIINITDLTDFLKKTIETRLAAIDLDSRDRESRLPYMFPTRPLSPLEISELAPECVGLRQADGKICSENPAVIWAKYTQAIRGIWVKPTLLATQQKIGIEKKLLELPKDLIIGTDKKQKVIVALTNFKTEDADWAKMACNKSNLSQDRYSRISELVNQTLRLKPRPDYVIFPELSLPLSWVDSISSRLLSAGISLIAGTEYRHYENNELLSEGCVVLSDNRLGFLSSVKIWQPKLEPAVGEDKELTSIYGKKWAYSKLSKNEVKPIYVHNGVHFGIMICSELQNSKARVEFQGELDALMVLSWNQDLDTFSALIEAAALDIHAYTILVNNRKYGDSRVRSPAKDSFMRDLARVRGGDNDFVVAATLDIESLREFQSRAKRWPQKRDMFKPLPEGYKIAKKRRQTPPK